MGLSNHNNNRNADRPGAFECAPLPDLHGHDEHVVVSFEASKVRDVLRHAFSSTDRRGEYRIPVSSSDEARVNTANENNKEGIGSPEKKAPDIWVVFDPELCLFSFKNGSPTVPIFIASSGAAESRAASGVEYAYPIQYGSDRVWRDVMDFMMQANQGQGVFYALSSEELRDHLDHRQAFMDVRFHADRIEWCTTSGLCLGTYSISEKR